MAFDVTILIPLFNEEDTIDQAITRSIKGLSIARKTGEIVVVDDGSTDASRDKVFACSRESPIEVRLIAHDRNQGVSAALRTGISNARGEIILILPGDLESNPEEDIPKLIEEIPRADLVVGWRQGRTGTKIVASSFYNFLYRSVLRVNVHDANWIKCFRRPVADNLVWKRDWNRYLVLYAARAGFRVAEVKVAYYKRKYGRSKFGIMRLPGGFLNFLRVYYETRTPHD